MAAASPLAWLLFLFFLPCFSNSCPPQILPCNPSIQIMPPFYLQSDITANDPPCQSYLKIGCDGDDGVLFFSENEYSLENISYDTNTVRLRVRDPDFSIYLNNSGCGNLYFNLSSPVSGFFDHDIYDDNSFTTGLSSVRCNSTTNKIQSPPKLFGADYKLSYSSNDESYELQHHCSRSPDDSDPSFVFIFLFKSESAELSLQAAAYSRDFEAQPDCFAHSIEVYCEGCKGQELPSEEEDKIHQEKHFGRNITIGTVLGCLAFIIIIGLVLFVKLPNYRSCTLSSKYGPQGHIEALLDKYGSIAPKRYKYGEVKKIAHSFQDTLGKGGFGTVYKGRLPDGRLVAVKLLHHSSSHGEEFLNEVMTIGRTSHVNVVSLLGFCIEGPKHALIYEYMPNGSLDNYIYSENQKSVLGWEKLYEIAISIARGLEYLHRGCNTRIVHFDIKPQNILLDEDFNPKIADFGLAKLCPPKESILSMAEMRGTIGYIAPEVFSRTFGVVSAKSDVYSYGMMVLEMVGGRRNAKPSDDNPSQVYFPHWLYDRLAEGHQIQAHDVLIKNEEIAKKMGMVGLWCTQTVPANRPSMSRVVEMMEKSLTELEMPPRPYFSSPPHFTLLSTDTSSS